MAPVAENFVFVPSPFCEVALGVRFSSTYLSYKAQYEGCRKSAVYGTQSRHVGKLCFPHAAGLPMKAFARLLTFFVQKVSNSRVLSDTGFLVILTSYLEISFVLMYENIRFRHA